MYSPFALNLATSGFQGIGGMVRMATSGFRARGYSRRKRACCGPQAIGDSQTASTFGMAAIGDPRSATMGALTTASATPASAFTAATGGAERTTITAQ